MTDKSFGGIIQMWLRQRVFVIFLCAKIIQLNISNISYLKTLINAILNQSYFHKFFDILAF